MKKIFIGFLLIGFICSGKTIRAKQISVPSAEDYVFTTPVPDNTDDPNYQDDQDYLYDENESNESKNKIPIVKTVLTGTLGLKEYYIKAKEGELVELDCLKYLETNVKKEDLVLIWYNDTARVATGTYIVGDLNRLKLGKGQNLVINSVNRYDSGAYKCEITGLGDDLVINVKLEVETPPKVEILANNRIVTGNTLSYKEHERIQIQCIATGVPKPTVRWSVSGKILESKDGVEVQGGNLVIRATHHHSGDYQCLAENALKQLDHGSIQIRINYAPRIKIHKAFVNSMEGSERALHCLFHSNPESEVIWEKNQHILKTNEKYEIIRDKHHGENRSVLIVKNINRSDLGVYQCKVQNIVGNALGNVSLIFTPEPAHFIEAPVEGRHVQIKWEIRSMLPLAEIILYYRKTGETPWSKRTAVDHSRNETHGIYYVSHKLQLEPGTWETRIKSTNKEGDSVMSDAEQFTVHSVIDIDDGDSPTGSTNSGVRLEVLSSITLFVTFEIVRRLLFTYHQN